MVDTHDKIDEIFYYALNFIQKLNYIANTMLIDISRIIT